MTDRNRRIQRRLATALTVAGLALAVPTGGFAHHRDGGAHDYERHRGDRHQRVEHRRDYDRHHRYDRHRRHDRRHDRYDRRHDRHRGWGWGWGHRRPRPYPVHVHGSSCGHRKSDYGFYCRPCGHRFGSLDRLHHHVHHVHHVPFWKLPFVILAKATGLYYYG